MPKFSFIVRDDGKLPEGIRDSLSKLFPAYAGKKLHLTIEEAKDKRSLNQNDYYRGVILPHVRQMMLDEGDGRSLDDWHEVLLQTFAPLEILTDFHGNSATVPKRTHRMTKDEMAKFITAVIAECYERGYPVPIQEGL